MALVRIGALVAGGASVQSFAAEVDAVIDAGGTAEEVVSVLVGVMSVVGTARAVVAAPTLALALGFDTQGAFEGFDEPGEAGSAEG